MIRKNLIIKKLVSLAIMTSITFGFVPVTRAYASDYEWTFGFTGDYQKFIVPYDGIYVMELYGASGGSANNVRGGYGGYSYGEKELKKGEVLYVYVGGQGGSPEGGWNGGGNGSIDPSGAKGTGGGGATDIRYKGTDLKDRIIVAGGGGGTDNGLEKGNPGGDGGGSTGGDGSKSESASRDEATWGKQHPGKGGTQSAGGSGSNSGSLGTGGSAVLNSDYGGGGGGYYGGGASGSDSIAVVTYEDREETKTRDVEKVYTETVVDPPYPNKVYKQGASDPKIDYVKMIQRIVGADVDGSFGPDTAKKVKEWQSNNSLDADGQVGPMTWNKMFSKTVTRTETVRESYTVIVKVPVTTYVRRGSSSAGGGSGYVGKVNNGVTSRDEHTGNGVAYITYAKDFTQAPETQPTVPPEVTTPPKTPDNEEPIVVGDNAPTPWTGNVQSDNVAGSEAYIGKPFNPYDGIPVVKTSNSWSRTYNVYSWTGKNISYNTVGKETKKFNKYTPGNKESKSYNQSETYKITSILFKSKYTQDKKLGSGGWVELTNAGALGLIKAGYGYELKITVNYKTNALNQPVPSISGANNENGTSVRPHNISPNLPEEIFVKTPDGKILSATGYGGTIAGMEKISESGDVTNKTWTYSIKSKDTLGIKSTPKLYIDENTKDGTYNLEVFTPVINGIPNKPNASQLGDSKTVKIKVNGSYIDDVNTHIVD